MTEKRSVLENPTGNDLGPVKKISHMRLPNLTKQRSSTYVKRLAGNRKLGQILGQLVLILGKFT